MAVEKVGKSLAIAGQVIESTNFLLHGKSENYP
jgi:hypothetical protein